MDINKALIADGVHKAFAHEGYVKSDGSRDISKMLERICEIVTRTKVLSKQEREEKAVGRHSLIAAVFPSLPGPKFDELEESQRPLAAAVYGNISKDVWSATSTSANGRLQAMIGKEMGNGYVLCRTKIGKELADAVYITDALECIRLDFTKPDSESLERRIELSTRNREMLMIRQPHNAKVYAKDYDKALVTAVTGAKNKLQLTAETVTAQPQKIEEETAE